MLTNLKHGRPCEGLVNENELFDVLSSRAYDFPHRLSISKEPKTSVKVRSIRKKVIFAAMPFDGRYDDTFLVSIASAAKLINAVATRVDREQFAGDIVGEIRKRIRNSAAVVGDLSESKPDVLYEIGYAHGIRIPTVHICSTSLAELPFDVRNWNALHYSIVQTHALIPNLTKRLKSVIDRS